MHRLLIAATQIQGGEARIDGDSLHYLVRVLRLREGDDLEVFDGAGNAWAARIARITGDEAVLTLGEQRRLPALPPITLAQGLAKGDKLELVVQKATELGAARLVPLQLERCVVQLDPARGARRSERWRRIAEESARQCGRADVPAVEDPTSLAAFFQQARERGEKVAVLYEEQDPSVRLGPWLERHREEPIALVVGPEGGLSPREVELAREHGAEILSLGRRILRTETVGLAVLSIALHLAGELG